MHFCVTAFPPLLHDWIKCMRKGSSVFRVSFLLRAVWRGREGRKDALRKPPRSVCLQSRVDVGGGRVWDGKAGRRQLLGFSVNWAELCPVIKQGEERIRFTSGSLPGFTVKHTSGAFSLLFNFFSCSPNFLKCPSLIFFFLS